LGSIGQIMPMMFVMMICVRGHCRNLGLLCPGGKAALAQREARRLRTWPSARIATPTIV
jgi:hypothetical protein